MGSVVTSLILVLWRVADYKFAVQVEQYCSDEEKRPGRRAEELHVLSRVLSAIVCTVIEASFKL